MDNQKKLEKETDLNQETELAQDKLRGKEYEPFFWVKNFLPTRKKRDAVLQASQEALYRKDIKEGNVAKLADEEAETVFASVQEAEAGDVVDGVDMGEFDALTFLKAFVDNREVGISAYRPRHKSDVLTDTDRIGLELGRMFAAQFPESVPVLYLKDTGTPSLEEAESFRDKSVQTLREYHIVKDDKSPRVVFGSDLVGKAESLVDMLDKDPKLSRKGFITRKNQQIVYTVRVPYLPVHREILLRGTDGNWSDEILDVLLNMDEATKDTCQVIALPSSYKYEQGRAWEILALMGFKPENYHNIYFEEQLDPAHVADVVAHRIADSIGAFATEKKSVL